MSDLRALLIAGSAPGCGKTVVTTGLTGVLKELGIQAQALKPLQFGAVVRPASDQQFMDAILRPMHAEESVSAESPYALSNLQWNRMLETCRKLVWPALIECPGSVASPWKFVEDGMFDVNDVSRLLNAPILLVVRKTDDLIAEAGLALTYLQERGANVIGWVAVETEPAHAPHWDEETRFLHARYLVPFLGEVAYSPSISVPMIQQGNLIRTVEAGIDLLPIQQALRPGLPL